ncbi:phosphopantetheine-binding protein [Rhodococcus erythropolis]|nr:phosphopantetheine-binding protein [Rhodococcus erythropolis]
MSRAAYRWWQEGDGLFRSSCPREIEVLGMVWDGDFEKIIRGSLRQLSPDRPLDPDARLVTLGLGSLQTVALLVALEDHYGVTFEDDDLTTETFDSAGSLWSALSRAQKGA